MIEYAWYGADGVEIRLGARASANGPVTLTLTDGRTLEATAVSSTDDSHVLFVFGLADGEVIYGTITHDSVDYEHTIRVAQLSSRGMRIAVWGCQANYDKGFHALDVIRSAAPDLCVCLGDFIYADAEYSTRFGENAVNVRQQVIRTVGADAYRPHWRVRKKSPQFKRLAAWCPQWVMWHDHEVFDNWNPGSVKNINKFYHPSSTAYDGSPSTVEQVPESLSQAEKIAAMQAIYTAGRTAFYEAFGMTNPINSDLGIDSGALYFRVRIPGLVELIVPDQITYCDMWDSLLGLDGIYTDLPGYTFYNGSQDSLRKMHGVTQQEWVLASLANSEAAGIPNKLLLLPTQPYEHNVGALNNPNTLANCTTERDEIVSAFGALTGAACHSNDSHQAAVYQVGDYFLCVNAGALSSGEHQQGAGYSAQCRWKTWGDAGQPPTDGFQNWAFGVVDVSPDRQTHSIVEAHTLRRLYGPIEVVAGGQLRDQRTRFVV